MLPFHGPHRRDRLAGAHEHLRGLSDHRVHGGVGAFGNRVLRITRDAQHRAVELHPEREIGGGDDDVLVVGIGASGRLGRERRRITLGEVVRVVSRLEAETEPNDPSVGSPLALASKAR